MKTFFSALAFTIYFFAAAQDSSWLQGRWVGDGFVGTTEEVWSAPAEDGTTMGMFRHMDEDGNSTFYELFILDETGLRLKHFSTDFTGWEEKDDFLHFKMVEVLERKVVLKGLVYELISENEMKVSLDMKTKEGGIKTEIFNFKRAD